MPSSAKEETESTTGVYRPDVNIDGVEQILQSNRNNEHRFRQYFFMAVLVLSAGVGVFSCVQITYDYFNTTRATKIELKQALGMHLPKVTVCPQTPDAFDEPRLIEYLDAAFPNISRANMEDFVGFMIAGSGFSGMTSQLEAENVSQAEVEKALPIIKEMYMQLKGVRTIKEFFEYFFNTFGYTCKQLFHQCSLGSLKSDCCDYFEPYYTVSRGRCMSLKVLSQERADELGKLVLLMNGLPSFLGFQSTQHIPNDLEVFIHQHNIDIAPFPRYHVRANYFNKLRLVAQKIIQLPSPNCGPNPYGKGTCHEDDTLGKLLRNSYNCTLPYWPIQHAGYQYEEIREIKTVSTFGYVSQIGGQLGLFLGSSIISFFQLTYLGCLCCKRAGEKRIKGYVRSRSAVAQTTGRQPATAETEITF